MSSSNRQRMMERAVERALYGLRSLVNAGAPALHLAPLVDLIETLIPETGGTLLSKQYWQELANLKGRLVLQSETKSAPALRIVK